jgi:hypothetical protein
MKITFFTLALSAANIAQAVKFVSGPEGWTESLGFKTYQQEDDFAGITERVGRAVVPKRQELKNRNPHIPNAKSVKIRYGPYSVPGARVYVSMVAVIICTPNLFVVLAVRA